MLLQLLRQLFCQVVHIFLDMVPTALMRQPGLVHHFLIRPMVVTHQHFGFPIRRHAADYLQDFRTVCAGDDVQPQ